MLHIMESSELATGGRFYYAPAGTLSEILLVYADAIE